MTNTHSTPNYDKNNNITKFTPVALTSICSLIFVSSVSLLLRDYAAIDWSIYGYRFDGITNFGLISIFASCITCSFFVPKKVESPSSLILIMSYILVVLPSFVCLVAMSSNSSTNHFYFLFSICISFSIACIFSKSKTNYQNYNIRLPIKSLPNAIFVIACFLILYLYIRFGSIIEFVSLDTLYMQRERGAADNFIDGYAQTYSQYVVSTALVTLGIYKKNIAYFLAGIAGSVINFGITAEKSGLMYPVFVIALSFALFSKRKFFTETYGILIGLSSLLIFSIYTRYLIPASEFLCWYLGTRTILTPGAFVVYYSDFFSQSGYTFLSHVRGLNLLIPMPSQYLNDPRWPALGIMVGEDYLGIPRLNANASFLATDGIASFGIWGCFVAFGILVLICRLFDYLGRGIPPRIILPILLPIALTLSNGSSLTVLTSFGGIFWMLIFAFAFREDPTPRRDIVSSSRKIRHTFS